MNTASSEKTPTVSIITPFLNGQRFFNEAVQSILAQTFQDWELLLIDDGSTDESTSYARRLADEHSGRIRYLEHPGHLNRGMPASRNLGIARARGKYIAFLDVDDVWLPEKLARQTPVLDEYPEVSMVYGPLVFWYDWTGNPADKKRNFVCPLGEQYNQVIHPPAMLLRQIEKADGLPAPSSVLLKTAIALEVGGFDESFNMYEDEVFFSKIALHYPVYVISESLDRYRQHPDSFSSRAIAAGDYTMSQGPENKARGRFLWWLREYISHSGLDDGTLMHALDIQLAPYENSTH
jgi:glycosyltransferase involved in cell wall biosynthesis